VTADPGILECDDVATRLAPTKWWLRLSDGGEELLTFPELMVLTYNLLLMRQQIRHRAGLPPGQAAASITFAVDELMQPQVAKSLLGKLALEGVSKKKGR
jgi:hypothetical protein